MAVHVLDPNWDVMLTVRSPTKPWVPEESNGPPPQPSGAPSQYRAAQDSPFFLEFIRNDPALQLQPLPVLDSEVGLGDAKAWLSIRMVSQPEVASVERESTRASAPSSRTPCGSPLPPGEHMSTSFGLSSRQLELASSHFRAIFQVLEQEKMQTEDHDVKLGVLIADWDVEATLIVMQVIHGQSAKVPVDVELLAKTAVLVDFLGCHETFKSVSARWFANMKEVPQVYCRDLVLWIVASRIFSEREIFSAVTKTAVVSCKSPLQPLGLPFPQPLIQKIDFRRRQCVVTILELLYDLRSFLSERQGCSKECSSTLLHTLTTHMRRLGILDVQLDGNLSGHSFASLAASARAFSSPECGECKTGNGKPPCALSAFLHPLIARIEEDLPGGLALETL